MLRRGSHLMRAVELVKHTTGVHVISMFLALDMAQLQTHAHTQTDVDNNIYLSHCQRTPDGWLTIENMQDFEEKYLRI